MASGQKSTQKLKIYCITKLRTDFIFLSDTRISNRSLVSDIKTIKTILTTNPYGQYSIFYNSTKNKRGTAILYKTNLNISEIQSVCDPEENFLLVLVEDTQGNKFILGSIYGPNEYSPSFFECLRDGLTQLGDHPIIMGGGGLELYTLHTQHRPKY